MASASIETATATLFARLIALPGGAAWFELRLDELGRVRLRAEVELTGTPAPPGTASLGGIAISLAFVYGGGRDAQLSHGPIE